MFVYVFVVVYLCEIILFLRKFGWIREKMCSITRIFALSFNQSAFNPWPVCHYFPKSSQFLRVLYTKTRYAQIYIFKFWLFLNISDFFWINNVQKDGPVHQSRFAECTQSLHSDCSLQAVSRRTTNLLFPSVVHLAEITIESSVILP